MSNEEHKKVDSILKPFEITDDQLYTIKRRLVAEFDRGLGKESRKSKNVLQMMPTYVTSLPDGTENGTFLALDFGGSNFRVLLVTCTDGKPTVNKMSKVHIPTEIMRGSGIQLFDFIADQVKSFTDDIEICNENGCIKLGFTFSFPCFHKGLASAELVAWTKGFDAPGVVGEDVVLLLQQAFERKNVQIEIASLTNDAVAVQMVGAASDSNCKIGFIIGTGSNAAYVEQLNKVETFVGQTDAEVVVIDTELGYFGDNGALDEFKTQIDEELDRNSLRPGKMRYEKTCAGFYLGTIVRLILIKLTEDGVLFDGKVPAQLRKEGIMETTFLNEVESDTTADNEHCKKALADFGIHSPSSADLLIVRKVCAAVRARAARIVAAVLAGVVSRIPHDDVTVNMDGSLYTSYPKYRDCVIKTTEMIVSGNQQRVKFISVQDGSGKGAAVIAAVAHRCEVYHPDQ